MSKTLIAPPPAAKHLLAFIMAREAPHGYGTVYGNHQDKLAQPLTQMTFDEVVAAGPTWTKRFGSSACGAYQFMRDTLDTPGTVKDLKGEYGLQGDEPFDEDLQDKLGYALLLRRGFARFIAGQMTVAAFGLALAQEWASFPVLVNCKGAHRQVTRGQSYYAGDGMNKALVKAADVEAELKAVLAIAHQEPAQAAVVVAASEAVAPLPTNGLSRFEVQTVQNRLVEKGYPVGKVDGIWGGRTKAAVAAFRDAAGMPEGGWDDDVKAALFADDAPAMEIGIERASATATDIAPTSSIVRKAQRLKQTVAGVAGTVAAPATVLGVVGQFTEAKSKIQPLIDAFTMVPAWVWGGAGIGLAIYLYVESQGIETKRVEMHQAGETA